MFKLLLRGLIRPNETGQGQYLSHVTVGTYQKTGREKRDSNGHTGSADSIFRLKICKLFAQHTMNGLLWAELSSIKMSTYQAMLCGELDYCNTNTSK